MLKSLFLGRTGVEVGFGTSEIYALVYPKRKVDLHIYDATIAMRLYTVGFPRTSINFQHLEGTRIILGVNMRILALGQVQA